MIVEQAFFRIAQEALANVARHSGARTVDLLLSRTENHLTLSIVDDGHGFDVTGVHGKGLGLSSMGERVAALDGTLRVESTPTGTRIEATVATPEDPTSNGLASSRREGDITITP